MIQNSKEIISSCAAFVLTVYVGRGASCEEVRAHREEDGPVRSFHHEFQGLNSGHLSGSKLLHPLSRLAGPGARLFNRASICQLEKVQRPE